MDDSQIGLIAVGLAVPSLCDWVAYPPVFGTIVNPFLFVPPAFEPKVQGRLWFRVLSIIAFLGVSGALLATDHGSRLIGSSTQPPFWPQTLKP